MRAHGTRTRYMHGPGPGQDPTKGCRCDDCVEANNAYARMQRKRKSLEGLGRTSGPFASPMVDAGPVRDRMLTLADRGVGYRRVADLAGVSKSSLLKVRTGERDRIRRETHDAVMALPLDADVADGQLIDAAPTWALIRQILRRKGWSKARISRELGNTTRALQLRDDVITARNARAIADLAENLGITGPDPDRRRFPLAPLLTPGMSIKELGRRTGVADRQLHRWKGYGIPHRQADEMACALGSHPATIWADWYLDDEAEAS